VKHSVSSQRTTSINWPSVYFTAELSGEAFQDVNVVTLKNYYVDKVYELAIDKVGMDPLLIEKCALKMLNSNLVTVREFVKVTPNKIIVVINSENVNDDAIWLALDRVAIALDKLDGTTGTIPFSEYVSFTTTDITWLRKH